MIDSIGVIFWKREWNFVSVKGMEFVVCFLLGNSPASKFYMPTFRNTLFYLHRRIGVEFYTYPPMKMEQTVFRNVGIYNLEAGELPRRKHTTLRTRRMFEIKVWNLFTSCGAASPPPHVVTQLLTYTQELWFSVQPSRCWNLPHVNVWTNTISWIWCCINRFKYGYFGFIVL